MSHNEMDRIDIPAFLMNKPSKPVPPRELTERDKQEIALRVWVNHVLLSRRTFLLPDFMPHSGHFHMIQAVFDEATADGNRMLTDEEINYCRSIEQETARFYRRMNRLEHRKAIVRATVLKQMPLAFADIIKEEKKKDRGIAKAKALPSLLRKFKRYLRAALTR